MAATRRPADAGDRPRPRGGMAGARRIVARAGARVFAVAGRAVAGFPADRRVLLQDHHGRAFTRERLDGVWTFLFFGYTHCPDICPSTLATLRRVERDLPAHPPIPRQHVLVSVDPARDTVEHLARYVAAFGPEFLGVTGPDGELARLARGRRRRILPRRAGRRRLLPRRPHRLDHAGRSAWTAGRAVRDAARRERHRGPVPGAGACGARRGVDGGAVSQASARARSPSTSSSTTSAPAPVSGRPSSTARRPARTSRAGCRGGRR